jgi:hypothetical protein
MTKNIKNLVLFKLGWVACVAFAAAGDPGLATLAVAAVVAAHLVAVPAAIKEAALLASAGAIGMAWESLLVSFGLVSYPGSASDASFAPYWIVAMWVLFATTINHGLAWTKRSWYVASIAGLIGGPLAFLGGANLGAVEFENTVAAMLAIGIGWAILLPALTLVAETIIDSTWMETSDERIESPAPVRYTPSVLRGLVPAPVVSKESRNVR